MRFVYLRYIITFFVLLLGISFANAQQDAMFTKYMFNQLSYNPAYAGSYEFMSINAVYRNQWWGFEGGPQSQTLTVHTPIANNRIGLGLSLINDKIGPDVGTTTANLAYAYHIPIGKGGGKLSIALQGGITNYRANFNLLGIRELNDEAFTDMTPNKWLPNFGAGVYYYSKHFYVGASVPHVLNNDLRSDAGTVKWAMQYRHYYFMAGGMVSISPAIKFKPSLLIKNVGLFGEFKNSDVLNFVSAHTEFDLDLSLLFYDMFWVGASTRGAFETFNKKSSMDSADIWAAYYLKNGIRIGLSYDYNLTKIQKFAQGTFDVMLGYDFSYKEKNIVTPRYF
jgi:type IX secretion system PorP/SprF family membrane protein